MQIKVENITFNYNNTMLKKSALQDISFSISDHEFLAIVGPTGSGKTTLIQHFTGLLRPTSGQILINEKALPTKGKQLAQIRRQIGLVFQFPEKQLFEETVYEDVAFGPKNLGFSDNEIEKRVHDALRMVELDFEKLRSRSPHRLSEGEKRRVALAGVLAMEPDVLVLDEPTACLDPQGVQCIENILQRLNRSGKTVIIISHNIDLVFRLASRIIVLSKGQLKYDGPKEKLIEQEEFLRNVGLSVPRIVKFLKSRLSTDSVDEFNNIYTKEDIETILRRS